MSREGGGRGDSTAKMFLLVLHNVLAKITCRAVNVLINVHPFVASFNHNSVLARNTNATIVKT